MGVYYTLAVWQFKPISSVTFRVHWYLSGGLQSRHYHVVAGNHNSISQFLVLRVIFLEACLLKLILPIACLFCHVRKTTGELTQLSKLVLLHFFINNLHSSCLRAAHLMPNIRLKLDRHIFPFYALQCPILSSSLCVIFKMHHNIYFFWLISEQNTVAGWCNCDSHLLLAWV